MTVVSFFVFFLTEALKEAQKKVPAAFLLSAQKVKSESGMT